MEKRSISFALSDSFVGLDFFGSFGSFIGAADHLYAMHSA